MKKALFTMIAILSATPAFADNDASAREKDRKFFTFGDNQAEKQGGPGCQSPKKPDYINQLSWEEKSIISTIYRNLVSQRIIERNLCKCDMLYPTYDKAIEIFQKEFVPIGLPTKYGTKEAKYIINFLNKEPYPYGKAVSICISQGIS